MKTERRNCSVQKHRIIKPSNNFVQAYTAHFDSHSVTNSLHLTELFVCLILILKIIEVSLDPLDKWHETV